MHRPVILSLLDDMESALGNSPRAPLAAHRPRNHLVRRPLSNLQSARDLGPRAARAPAHALGVVAEPHVRGVGPQRRLALGVSHGRALRCLGPGVGAGVGSGPQPWHSTSTPSIPSALATRLTRTWYSTT